MNEVVTEQIQSAPEIGSGFDSHEYESAWYLQTKFDRRSNALAVINLFTG